MSEYMGFEEQYKLRNYEETKHYYPRRNASSLACSASSSASPPPPPPDPSPDLGSLGK